MMILNFLSNKINAIGYSVQPGKTLVCQRNLLRIQLILYSIFFTDVETLLKSSKIINVYVFKPSSFSLDSSVFVGKKSTKTMFK